MAFIPDKNFKYDIFISYTHIDNTTTDKNKKGWVDDFYEQLSLKLKKVVGKSVAIWRDVRHIDSAQAFGDEVKKGSCCASSGWIEESEEYKNDPYPLPVGFVAKTEEDCRKMAMAFASCVS